MIVELVGLLWLKGKRRLLGTSTSVTPPQALRFLIQKKMMWLKNAEKSFKESY